jgi:hypothetical protein
MDRLKLHNAIVNCPKPLPQPENGMDTKALLMEAKKIWEEQNGKGLEGLRRRGVGNTQPYDLEDYAEFEKAYDNALQVLGNECGVTEKVSTPTETKLDKSDIERRIKSHQRALKYARTEQEKSDIERRIKSHQRALKYA